MVPEENHPQILQMSYPRPIHVLYLKNLDVVHNINQLGLPSLRNNSEYVKKLQKYDHQIQIPKKFFWKNYQSIL